MAIYGRINDVSPLKGFNGNEISYQSIQLPSWLEEKDKKNFLRFYYMLRYGIEIGDNNILATQVYDEGKSKSIILYSGLCGENIQNSIHVESNNTPLVPAIRTSNNSITNTNRASYNYGIRLSITGAWEFGGTNAFVHLDIYNGFYGNGDITGYGILDYAKDLGFYIKCRTSIYDNNYGNIETIIDYNSNYQINVHNTGEHNLDKENEAHSIKFNFIQIILNYNNMDRNIAQILFDDYLFNSSIKEGSWSGGTAWNKYSHGEDVMRSFEFSNNNFNWDF